MQINNNLLPKQIVKKFVNIALLLKKINDIVLGEKNVIL